MTKEQRKTLIEKVMNFVELETKEYQKWLDDNFLFDTPENLEVFRGNNGKN